MPFSYQVCTTDFSIFFLFLYSRVYMSESEKKKFITSAFGIFVSKTILLLAFPFCVCVGLQLQNKACFSVFYSSMARCLWPYCALECCNSICKQLLIKEKKYIFVIHPWGFRAFIADIKLSAIYPNLSFRLFFHLLV